MGLFNRRKKHTEDEVVSHDVPMSTVARWYLYDTDLTDDVNGLAEMIGLTPISDEGEAKEREESTARIDALRAIYPFLDLMSNISAEALTMHHLKELTTEDDIEKSALVKDLKNMQVVYRAVALSTLIGSFSIALNLGLIDTDAVKLGVMDMEIDDDEF